MTTLILIWNAVFTATTENLVHCLSLDNNNVNSVLV